MLEFALILPIIMYFLCGIFDLGFASYAFSNVSDAARNGARYAITHGCDNGTTPYTTTDISNVVKQSTPALSNISVTVSPANSDCSGSSGSYTCTPGSDCLSAVYKSTSQVKVTVTYTYTPFTPIINHFVKNVPITATSSMIDQQ